MASYDYDFFVIGAGSGGVRAARMAGGFNARVGIAEERYLGGTCVNVGCVPKKLFAYASHFASDFADAEGFGWSAGSASFDWPTLIKNKDREIHRLNGIYEKLLTNAGCQIINGRGRVVDGHTVEVNGNHYTAEHILVATGGRPRPPQINGGELAITSDEAFFLEELPQRIVVIGGGYIALEFASIFRGLGREVHLLHRGALPLRDFDEDVRHAVTAELERRGIIFHFNQTAERMLRDDSAVTLETSNGETIAVDLAMCAIGRVPNTHGLGLEDAGVQMTESGAVKVNHRFQTSVASIYAVGDVIDRVQLTPVALAEGMSVAHDLFCEDPHPINYDNIPTAVFTQPPVATVGLSEQEAHEKCEQVHVYSSEFRPLKNTVSGSAARAMMKLVVDGTTGRVLGCHMVGDDAPEIIQGLAIALNCGATKAQFDATIGLHPSAAEEFVTMRTKRAD